MKLYNGAGETAANASFPCSVNSVPGAACSQTANNKHDESQSSHYSTQNNEHQSNNSNPKMIQN